jgi:hypothetical protein
VFCEKSETRTWSRAPDGAGIGCRRKREPEHAMLQAPSNEVLQEPCNEVLSVEPEISKNVGCPGFWGCFTASRRIAS